MFVLLFIRVLSVPFMPLVLKVSFYNQFSLPPSSHPLPPSFSQMKCTGIPELRSVEDLEYLRSVLILDRPEDKAAEHFRQQIQKCLKLQWSTQLSWFAHNVVHRTSWSLTVSSSLVFFMSAHFTFRLWVDSSITAWFVSTGCYFRRWILFFFNFCLLIHFCPLPSVHFAANCKSFIFYPHSLIRFVWFYPVVVVTRFVCNMCINIH